MKLKKFSGLFIPHIFCILCIYSHLHHVHSLYFHGTWGEEGVHPAYTGGRKGNIQYRAQWGRKGNIQYRVHGGEEGVHTGYMRGGTYRVHDRGGIHTGYMWEGGAHIRYIEPFMVQGEGGEKIGYMGGTYMVHGSLM